jgi:hypothetical protein
MKVIEHYLNSRLYQSPGGIPEKFEGFPEAVNVENMNPMKQWTNRTNQRMTVRPGASYERLEGGKMTSVHVATFHMVTYPRLHPLKTALAFGHERNCDPIDIVVGSKLSI